MSWEPLPPERGRGRDPSLSYVPHGSAVIYTPPTPRGNAWDHEEESDGGRMESGPSDYARRAWIGGLEAHRRASEGSDEAADGSDEWSRQRRRRRRRRVSAGIGGKVGDDEEAREMICRADKHPTRTRTHSPPTPRPRRRSATRRLAAAISTTALLSSLPIARAAPAPSGKSPSQTPRDIPTPTFSPTVAVFTRDVPTKPTTVFAQVEWQRQKRDGVQYLTSAEPPTMMPTDIRNVPETALPYLFSQGSDGGWVRVQGGWKLYGRQVGATQTATWAVESALPYGWGSQSTRTDFYRVPLIVVAAVVLAVSIVIWIAVTAFKRRKQHRRQKRRAERLRRRALAAAGLSEQDARDEEAQRKFEEKLDELQRERRMKKGEQFGRGASTGRGREAKGERAKASRVKVRLWSAGTGLGLGLRRRRGARGGNGGSGAGGGDGDDAGSDGDGRTPRPGSLSSIADDGSPKPPAPGPELDISRATRGTGQGQGQGQGQRRSQDTDRSTPTVPSSHTALESGLPSRENTTTEDSTESRDRSDRFSSLGSTRAGDSPDSDRRYAQLQGAAGTGTGTGTGTGAGAGTAGATYFPPAYRPASVRSLPAAGSSRPSGFGPASSARHASHAGQQGELDPHGHATGSGLGSFDNDDDDEHGHSHGHANEKTRAPGYYPAPSTAEGEVALAVASRAEGKQRVMDPEADAAIRAQAQAHPQLGDDEGEGVLQRGHVATDDKRVLEQMRLAASAPPARAYSPGDNGGVHAIGPTDGEEAGEEAVRGIGYGSGGEQGPSAPYIETDQDGFETLPPSLSLGTPIDHSEYASSSTHTPTSPNVSTRNQPSSPHAHTRPSHMSLHPDIPLPPARQPTRTLSMREEVEREVHEQLDELNLLPSAPPVPLSLTRGLSVPSAPSAPPDLGLEDGEADGREDSASGAPSAPPLEMEEDGAENDVPREPSVAGASATASATASGEVEGHDQAGSGGVRVEGRFLPRYEP